MFEILDGVSHSVFVEAIYWTMLRLRQQNRQLDRIAEALTPEEAAAGEPVREEDRIIHALLREIRQAAGKPLSTLTEDEMGTYVFPLSDILMERGRTNSPEIKARAQAALEEMRRRYPSPLRRVA
jgi:hypothetical protein